jgi:hypothetical protein
MYSTCASFDRACTAHVHHLISSVQLTCSHVPALQAKSIFWNRREGSVGQLFRQGAPSCDVQHRRLRLWVQKKSGLLTLGSLNTPSVTPSSASHAFTAACMRGSNGCAWVQRVCVGSTGVRGFNGWQDGRATRLTQPTIGSPPHGTCAGGGWGRGLLAITNRHSKL